MRSTLTLPRRSLRLAVTLALGLAASAAAASQFDFLAAPQTDLNRVYRIDRVTGEVGACQYGLQEGSIGVTLCFPAGEGAGRQAEPSSFGLVASRHEREGGIFRVDHRTGAMSICYVFEEKVVCTPPQKGALPVKEAANASDAPASPGAKAAQPETTGSIVPAGASPKRN